MPRGTQVYDSAVTLFEYGTLTLSGRPSQCLSPKCYSALRACVETPAATYYPPIATPTRFHDGGLDSSPFARHYSENPFFS